MDDHLHRPVRMTNAAKATVWNAVWLPACGACLRHDGGVHSITGSGAVNARFPGQWFQLEAGLHYNWHRHYDPTLGRYTQPDPLGFVDGPSVYGYAGSDPFANVDPEGLNWLRTVWDFIKSLRYEGPGKDYILHGHGRIAQIRSGEWFVRLDFDPLKHNQPRCYHLNIGSSKPGRFNKKILLYTPRPK